MAFKKEAVERKEWTTKDADPTTVVRWRIYATKGTPDGEVDKSNYLDITEFQGIYVGQHVQLAVGGRPAKPNHRIPDNIAAQLHHDLEEQWSAARDEEEPFPFQHYRE